MKAKTRTTVGKMQESNPQRRCEHPRASDPWGKRSTHYTIVPAWRRVRTKCACNEGVATLIVSPYNSKDKSGGVCGWASKHAKTSHGVSQDEGGGGGPALCNRLTPCFCWHGCLRMPGSTQTEEPGCPTTTHIWVRRCRLGVTVGRYAFSSHQARAHAFSRPAARARASCM